MNKVYAFHLKKLGIIMYLILMLTALSSEIHPFYQTHTPYLKVHT